MTRLTETVLHELPPVEDGVLKGAKLLGLVSRNSRRYEGKALEAAKGLYEGRKVYVDHPSEREAGAERKFNDWAGVIENVRFKKNDGLYGDIVLRQESSHFKGIVEAASNPKFRKNCGFSHVADGEGHFDGATEIIESIKEVFSVDLVTDPATTGGMYESVTTIREIAKALPDSHKQLRTRLVEMIDGGFMGSDFSLGREEKPDQPEDPLAQLTSILRDTIAALADSLKALAKANKPEPVIPAATPPAATPSDKADPFAAKDEDEEEEEEMKPEDKEKIAAFESMQRENAELKASKLLLESGRAATAVRMKALANCATDEEQQELLNSWPRIEESGRPARSPALIETEHDFPRDNPEKFAALLR